MRLGQGGRVLALREPVMDDEDLMTEEDRNRKYLRQHPARELSMWQDWVLTVCGWRKIAPPTGHEWDALTKQWHHGKMPVTSVDELEAFRKTPNVPVEAGPTVLRWTSPRTGG